MDKSKDEWYRKDNSADYYSDDWFNEEQMRDKIYRKNNEKRKARMRRMQRLRKMKHSHGERKA